MDCYVVQFLLLGHEKMYLGVLSKVFIDYKKIQMKNRPLFFAWIVFCEVATEIAAAICDCQG